MIVKLRDAVEVAIDEKGAIFRMVDRYLPLNGQGVPTVISVLAPLLDGRFTEEEVCARLGEVKRPVVKAIISALRNAGMLYNRNGNALWRSARTDGLHNELLRRAEWCSEDPDRDLEAFFDTRILLLGNLHLISPLLEAGVALGVRHQDFILVTSGSEPFSAPATSVAVDIVQEHRHMVRELTVTALSELASSGPIHDFVVVASALPSTSEAINRILMGNGYATVPIAPLLECSDSLLVGPLSANVSTTLMQDIVDRFGETMSQGEFQDPDPLGGALSDIGNYILMQRIFDIRTSLTL